MARTILGVEELEARMVLTTPTSTIPFTFNVPANVGSTIYLVMYGNISNAPPLAPDPVANSWDQNGNYSPVPASGTLTPVSFPLSPSGTTFTVQIPNIPAITNDAMILANARIVIGIDAAPVLTIDNSLVNAPNPGNATDPNNTINYDFVEFTLDLGGMHINTTTIDQFGFPLTVTTPNNTPPVTSQGVGVQLSRGDMFAQYPSYINGLAYASNAQGYLTSFTDGAVGGTQRRLLAPQYVLQLESAQPTQQNATLAKNGTLPHKVFWYVITATNTNGINNTGETIASNMVMEVAGSEPDKNTIVLTINPFINATGYNIYRSPPQPIPSSGPIPPYTGAFYYLDLVAGGGAQTYPDDGTQSTTSQQPPANNYTYDAMNAYFNAALTSFFAQYQAANSFSLTVDGDLYTGSTLTDAAGRTYLSVTNAAQTSTLTVYEPFFSTNTNIANAPPPPDGLPDSGQSPAQMVFACDGVFNSDTTPPSSGPNPLADFQNMVVSAFNRGIATSVAPANWATASTSFYAPGSTANFYAAFFHQGGVSLSDSNGNELAYGFPYDDQGGFSSSITDPTPTSVTVTLGTWALQMPFSTGAAGQFPTGITVGDFNGDLQDDVAVANYGPTGGDSVSVLFGTGQGGFGSTTTLALPVNTNPFGIATGTFIKGSSALGIVTGNFGGPASGGRSVAVFLSNGGGTFQAPLLLPAMDSAGGLHKIVSVATGDLNNDQLDDIVAGSGDGTYTVYLSNGDGSFKSLPSKSALTPIFGVAIAPFDSAAGLVVAAYAADKIGVLPGNGDGTFAAPIFTSENGLTNEFLATGDFNHDGTSDVATSNKDSNTVSILLGNGNGTFSLVTTYPVGLTPLGIVVADLNLDNQFDVAVANLASNSISVLLGLGNGTFAPAQTVPGGPSPIGVAAGEFGPSTNMLDLVFISFFGSQHDTVTIATDTAPPVITSFTPASGTAGTPVILNGANFLVVLAVTFNGVAAPNFVVNSPDQITVFVPMDATSGLIAVSAAGGIGVSATPFMVT